MTKKNIMPIVILVAICVIVAAILAAINLITEPIIKKAEEQKVYDSFRVVLDGDFEDAEIPENAPKSVTALYKVTEGGSLKGHVVTLKTKGYAGDISITVGIDSDGKVTKAIVTNESESHGKSGMDNYTDRFAGVGADTVADVETFSGATISSTAIKGAISDAVNMIAGNEAVTPEEDDQLPRTDAEIADLASQLVGEGANLTDVTPDGTKLVKRVYKDNGGKGYVAYALVISENYGTVETETLIHVDNTGKIVNVKKLVWKTSDAIYGYVPPTEEDVNAFYDRLINSNSETIGDVELVTNATNTSTNLVDSVKEALSVVEGLIKNDMPREESEVIILASQLVGEGASLTDVTPNGTKLVKRVYKDNGGKGYVAYAVVISPNYGTVETETLIHVDNAGKIVNVKKLVWKTSDAIYGYVPPTEEAVNEFYGKLTNKSSQSIGDVELVTNATNTATRLLESISEALAVVDTLIANNTEVAENYTARIVGIVILSLGIVCPIALTVYKSIRRRRKA